MKIMQFWSSKKYTTISLIVLLTMALVYSCKKSDQHIERAPVISYQQKIISIPVDASMIPVRPDSTGGAITEYSIQPMLPKGISINRINGVISGQASDTLSPTRFVVTATGPGGRASDTLLLSIGTIAFTYGVSGTFVFEKNSTELSTTPISPTIMAGSFTQFFLSPSPENLASKTGLTFNTQTGQISGTPTTLTSISEVPTPVTYTVTGISSGNKATSTIIKIVINDKRPSFTYTFAGSYTVGTAVGNTLTPTRLAASGGIVKYRIAPGSADLPAGLKLDSLNGGITGTPTTDFNGSVVIRGLNTGGYQDVNLSLVINATAVAPQVRYMMSLASGNAIDTLAPALMSGNTVYLTKSPDAFGGVSVYLNPVLIAGQAGTAANAFVASPAFVSGAANENITISASNGIISGIPGQFTATNTPAKNISIVNAVTGGPAGSFNMNIVANSAFFTYNADNGKGVTLPNVYYFVQGQQLNLASGAYPGYTDAGLSPVGGTNVVNYAIYPSNTNTPAFANTGLAFNIATGVISGTPTTATLSFNNYTFWDYVISGKKADGSFTLYKIRVKIYRTTAEWSL
jgi:hypothetical protein